MSETDGIGSGGPTGRARSIAQPQVDAISREAPSLKSDLGLACPVPLAPPSRITIAHGGGGRLTQRLVETTFLPAFDNPALAARHDGGVIEHRSLRLATTTDSYVVRPLFFPGGDIGSLAVNGTINDLAMCGARPLGLTAALILEEGVEHETVRRVAESMGRAARAAGVPIVSGDTKVVERGKGDGVYVTTSGVGVCEHTLDIRPSSVTPGDVVILSGDVGRHGIAVLAAREGLAFEAPVASDTQPLWTPVRALLDAGIQVHCLRDLTRGGLVMALVEIAESGCAIDICERAIVIDEAVRGACEILGLDPLLVANEGRFIAFVPEAHAERALSALAATQEASGAALVGRVREGSGVTLETALGTRRVLTAPSGEQLPRIC
jgi:hydrogenase expression/formation protein HypE